MFSMMLRQLKKLELIAVGLLATSLVLGVGLQSATAKSAMSTTPAKMSSPHPVMQQTSSSRSQVLRIGSQGQSVRELQTALKKAGVYSGAIDGMFGRQTQSSVMKLQQAKKLSVDRVVGTKTWAVL